MQISTWKSISFSEEVYTNTRFAGLFTYINEKKVDQNLLFDDENINRN